MVWYVKERERKRVGDVEEKSNLMLCWKWKSYVGRYGAVSERELGLFAH